MSKYVYRGVRYKEAEDAARVSKKAALEEKLGMKLTWRQYNLIADGMDAPPITRGRPVHMVSHDVLAENRGTDHHVVEGLDTGVEQTKLLERMRRRKAGGI